MKHTDLSAHSCPVARGLSRVGEWWSILILRDALFGLRRFDEFEKSLGIAPNMLARRLTDLVGAGLLERRQYSDRPARYEYVLTETGRAFQPVILAFIQWGNAHLSPEGQAVQLVERESGRSVTYGLVDLETGRPITSADHVVAPGPAADDTVRNRFDYIAQKKHLGRNGNLHSGPPDDVESAGEPARPSSRTRKTNQGK